MWDFYQFVYPHHFMQKAGSASFLDRIEFHRLARVSQLGDLLFVRKKIQFNFILFLCLIYNLFHRVRYDIGPTHLVLLNIGLMHQGDVLNGKILEKYYCV